MIFVIKHTNLSIFEGYEYALDIGRLFNLKLANISDLTWHALDEIHTALVEERVDILIHSRYYKSFIKFKEASWLGFDVNLKGIRDDSILYLVSASVTACYKNLIVDVKAARSCHKDWD